jgi:hypothetical protein
VPAGSMAAIRNLLTLLPALVGPFGVLGRCRHGSAVYTSRHR